MRVVRNTLLPIGKKFGAINLFGVLFIKRGVRVTPGLVNHEKIHTYQMRELFYIGFYLLYVGEWLLRLVCNRGNSFRAYEEISFEKEAYKKQDNPDYLKKRRRFAQWRKYD